MQIGHLVHSLALAVVSSVLVAPVAAAAPAPNGTVAPVASRADRDADALAVATDLVAAEEPELHLSRFDEVQAQDVLRSGDLRFVPFERTYRGLPVVGGDFVVVVDGAGGVAHVSVAQTDEVDLADTTPTVAAPLARSKSA